MSNAADMNVRINAATLEDKAQAQRYVEERRSIQVQPCYASIRFWPKWKSARR
jgi:hypothetical protein